MLSDVCLSDVCLVHPGGVCGQPAGWRVLADRARPAWLKAAAALFRCRPGRGHIVVAARLQLVNTAVPLSEVILINIFYASNA